MMRFKLNIADRKELVKRLGELTGTAPHYTRMPRCAYEIGVYTVERDGSLTVGEEEAAGQEETAAQEGMEPLDLALSFPMGEHTGVSLRNLVNMVYSRGPLLSKASGGNFRVEKELAERLRDDACTATVQTFLKALADYMEAHGGMEGLQITEQQISFTGFPVPADQPHADAFLQLAAMMNAMALSQKRIQAKEVSTDNEKYAFRIWLLRLGMNGDAYKSTRKVMMENLGGHAAFRTPEEAEKAKAKNKAKREAKKIELAELEADTRPNAELNGLDEAQTEEAVADAAYIAAVNASFEE